MEVCGIACCCPAPFPGCTLLRQRYPAIATSLPSPSPPRRPSSLHSSRVCTDLEAEVLAAAGAVAAGTTRVLDPRIPGGRGGGRGKDVREGCGLRRPYHFNGHTAYPYGVTAQPTQGEHPSTLSHPTRSPMARCRTSEPMAATNPTTSWPGMRGNAEQPQSSSCGCAGGRGRELEVQCGRLVSFGMHAICHTCKLAPVRGSFNIINTIGYTQN